MEVFQISGYTMNNVEVLYSYAGAATTTTPSASAVSLIATYPPIVIPPGYFSKLGANSSSLRVRLGGVIVTTATIPTFLWGLAITPATTTPAAFSATTSIAATTAIAPATAKTGGVGFMADVDITVRTITQVASTVIVSGGMVVAPETITTGWSFPAGGVAPTFSTWEMDLSYFLWPYLTLGAATAGNTATVHYLKLYGEN
jgi:hypothetical protein